MFLNFIFHSFEQLHSSIIMNAYPTHTVRVYVKLNILFGARSRMLRSRHSPIPLNLVTPLIKGNKRCAEHIYINPLLENHTHRHFIASNRQTLRSLMLHLYFRSVLI